MPDDAEHTLPDWLTVLPININLTDVDYNGWDEETQEEDWLQVNNK